MARIGARKEDVPAAVRDVWEAQESSRAWFSPTARVRAVAIHPARHARSVGGHQRVGAAR